jgi:hypothetical protein
MRTLSNIDRFWRIMAAMNLTAGALSGCTNPFSPPEIGGAQLEPILQQTSVNAVLNNFRYAYENRDIDVYENVLDPDFVFFYFDPERIEGIDQVLVPRDGPAGDLERTRRMFDVFDDIRLPTWDSTDALTVISITNRSRPTATRCFTSAARRPTASGAWSAGRICRTSSESCLTSSI